jgi:NitT/TauT family transport system ATP-binding protein
MSDDPFPIGEPESNSAPKVQNTSLATVFFEQLVPESLLQYSSQVETTSISNSDIRIDVQSKMFEKEDHKSIVVLQDVKFVIPRGQFLCLNGPNGCGKTTLLKIVAGLDKDFIGEIDANQSQDNVGFIFQNYKESLFPWMNNLDNISYSFLLKGDSKKHREETVRAFLNRYDLVVDLHAYPYQQSGGQQQIVSILRAMLHIPRVLIMDEPFSSLDQSMRLKMNEIVQRYWEEHSSTIVFISHDLDESLLLADRLIVMRKLTNQEKGSLLGAFVTPFARPRKAQLIESIDFFNVKSQILALKRKDAENA